ncbi:MAG: amidohydrolase family protein [Propionicimonas sp.]
MTDRAATGRTAIVGADVVTPDAVLEQHAVIVEQDAILAVVPIAELPQTLPRHQLDGGYLTPGLIDIHVHGAAGRGFNEATEEAFAEVGRTLLAAGVTTALPSLGSAPIDDLRRALDALAAVQGLEGLPELPGVHFEGPYFAPEQRGAQSLDDLRTPDDGSIDTLLERPDLVRMMSFAPELPGAVRLTERLVAAGVVAAAGHSGGTDADLASCQAAGLSHVIHLYSGQSSLTRRGPWRVPGLLEATLASEGLTVELIADGRHLPEPLMRIAYRCLAGNLCLVSDATAGAGLPDGSRYRIGRHEYLVEDGVGVTLDKASFGGSTTLLPAMLPVAAATFDCSLPELIAMFTTIPARAARLAGVGRIAPGQRADLLQLDRDLVPRQTYHRGAWRPCVPPRNAHTTGE